MHKYATPENFSRREQLDFYSGFDNPTVNIAALVESEDFVTPAKRHGYPPFAVILHALAQASLDIDEFRFRIMDDTVYRVDRVIASYATMGKDGNVNFSAAEYSADWPVFLDRYLMDKVITAAADALRKDAMDHRDYLFATCLPWLRFTAIQHPTGRFNDSSIPAVAVGKFGFGPNKVDFPLSVQVHHGLADGVHIARYFDRVTEILNAVAGGSLDV